MKKRVLSLFLALILVLGILPSAALAAGNGESPAGYGKVYVTSNVADVIWTSNGSYDVTGITDKPVIWLRSISTDGEVTNKYAPNIKIMNYTQLSESYTLDYISFDGHQIPLTDFTTTLTAIDTSGWTDSALQGKDIRISLNSNCPLVYISKNQINTLTSDANIVIQFKATKSDKATLTVNAGDNGSFVETKYVAEHEDGSYEYTVYAKPDNNYQLSSYNVKGTETRVALNLTGDNYRWVENDNFFNITISKDTEITLNFTSATMELELWSYQPKNATDNSWNVDMFGRILEADGTDKWNRAFEENKQSVPLLDDLGAKFFFKLNIKGFKDYGTEGENCKLKLYSGDTADESKLLFDSTAKEYVVNTLPSIGNGLRGDRSVGAQVYVSSIPSDLSSIYIEFDWAGYHFTGTYPVQMAKDLAEVKEFTSYYTNTYGLDKQGKEAYTAAEKATEGYQKYCQYSSFRYVLRLAYNEYLTKIAAEPNEETRKALLAEGKQALDDAAVGKDCNAVVFSFIEKDGVKAIPAMVAVPNDVEDYTQHPSAGTTAHIAMQAALEALYPGNWTYTYHSTQFGAFVNKVSAGGETDIGQTVISTEGGSTGTNYGFWGYNGINSDWGVSNYNPFDGDVMYWGNFDVEKNWVWAKLRLYYGSDEALDAALEERDVYEPISKLSAKQLKNIFSDLDDGSGKDFFRRYGQFRDVEAYEEVIRDISAIGSVGPDSGETLKKAREAYNALSKEQQAKVYNLSTLEEAEAAYAALVGKATVTAQTALTETLNTLNTNGGEQLTVGSQNGEWAILALARAGLISGQDASGQVPGYLAAVETALTEGTLTSATDYARVVLALTSLGVQAPQAMIEQCENLDLIDNQGMNAQAFCLLALDSMPYDAENTEIRETLVNKLLQSAMTSGGWSYTYSTVCDPDMTGMVIQALAPYYEKNDAVKTAVDKALEALKLQQKPTGGFASFGLYNAESNAQIVAALCALGQNPTNWNSKDVQDALLHFYNSEKKGFSHALGQEYNQIATEQSAYALVAAKRLSEEKSGLYDMDDAFESLGNRQILAAARLEVLTMDAMTVAMDTANTEETVAAWVEAQLEDMGFTGTAYTVTVTDLTAAVAGTATNKNGTNGSFTATVVLKNGAVSGDALTVTGTITATAYVAPTTPVTPVVPSTPSKPSQTTTTVTKKNPFTDVAKGDWYYDAVQYAYENGLMNGTGSGVFSPNATTTRGMIVTILARMEGVSTDQGETWYEAGQEWAMKLGISDGTNMEGSITREQLAAMLYRYAQLKGYDVSAKASLKGFADADQISDWAVDAMQWAVGCGLMQGDNNRLTPTATATRAQVATMLMRLEETF